MNITVYFSNSSVGETGLSPTIKIVRSDNTVIVASGSLSELSNAAGWYVYDFSSFDSLKDYVVIADAGTDTIDDRYPTTSIGSTHIAGAVWEKILENNRSIENILKLMSSALLGTVSGAGTTSITFKGIDDSTDRIVATMDSSGNRTAIALDDS